MTVKVVGHWEKGWQAPINEYDLWIHPLKEFGIEYPNWYMCSVSGIGKKVIERDNLSQVLDENPDLPRVYIDEEGDCDLADFEHPKDCIYITGRCGFNAWQYNGRSQDHSIVIPTKANTAGLWGHQCATLILYDRLIKG